MFEHLIKLSQVGAPLGTQIGIDYDPYADQYMYRPRAPRPGIPGLPHQRGGLAADALNSMYLNPSQRAWYGATGMPRTNEPWHLPLELGLLGAVMGGGTGAMMQGTPILKGMGVGGLLGALLGTAGAYKMTKDPEWPKYPEPTNWQGLVDEMGAIPGTGQIMRQTGEKMNEAYANAMTKSQSMPNLLGAAGIEKSAQGVLGAAKGLWTGAKAMYPAAKSIWQVSKPIRKIVGGIANTGLAGYGGYDALKNIGGGIESIRSGDHPSIAAGQFGTAASDIPLMLGMPGVSSAVNNVASRAFGPAVRTLAKLPGVGRAMPGLARGLRAGSVGSITAAGAGHDFLHPLVDLANEREDEIKYLNSTGQPTGANTPTVRSDLQDLRNLSTTPHLAKRIMGQ